MVSLELRKKLWSISGPYACESLLHGCISGVSYDVIPLSVATGKKLPLFLDLTCESLLSEV